MKGIKYFIMVAVIVFLKFNNLYSQTNLDYKWD